METCLWDIAQCQGAIPAVIYLKWLVHGRPKLAVNTKGRVQCHFSTLSKAILKLCLYSSLKWYQPETDLLLHLLVLRTVPGIGSR